MANAQSEGLIDGIYEAALLSETWPDALQALADSIGSKGAAFVVSEPENMRWVASTRIATHVADYMAEGWGTNGDHAGPLLAEGYPGFRAETAYRSVSEIERLPVHAEFLGPRGFIAGAATVLPGMADNALHIAFEGFASHDVAESAVSRLDTFRPHLARAIGLSTAMQQSRSRQIVDDLALANIAAAIISRQGMFRAANSIFNDWLGNEVHDVRGRFRFADRFLNQQFLAALTRTRSGYTSVQSIALPRSEARSALAVHIVPLCGDARELAGTDGLLLIATRATNAAIPGVDLLRLLFDLTPAEARLTRRLLEVGKLDLAAQQSGIGLETARTHLSRVFSKTGTNRQPDLIRLLSGMGSPVGADPDAA